MSNNSFGKSFQSFDARYAKVLINTTTSVKRLVTEDGIDVTCPKGIADHFNNFFVNVGVTLASKFSTDTSKVNPPVSEKLFNFSKTNTKCVQDHIKDLKNG